MKKYILSLFLFCLLGGVLFRDIESAEAFPAGQSLPKGFSGYAVFMATGQYDPTIPPSNPELQPIEGFAPFLDGAYFQETILERTPQEIEDKRNEAVDFFYERFGIDINDPDNQDRIVFLNYMTDPRAKNRAYTIGGFTIPRSGWVVNDGGWLVVVIDPNGFTLGGEFVDRHVPIGTSFASGDFIIHPNRGSQRSIQIAYKTSIPVVLDASGYASSVLEINYPVLGAGVAHSLSRVSVNEQGWVDIEARNILTIPRD